MRVSSVYFASGDKIAGRWEVEKFGNRTEPTDQGLAYFIPKPDRALLAIHKHMIEDGEYDAPENAVEAVIVEPSRARMAKFSS